MLRVFGLFNKKWVRQYDDTLFSSLDLEQFRSHSCRYLGSYFAFYLGLLLDVAAFASDIYTAVVLLAFDRWSSSITPFVPIRISRWIFAGCIILSVVLLIFDFIAAYTTMRTKNISLCYTNSIARNIYSIRGYQYFCLFAKITKSRSKTEYVALFVYFTFKGWIRLIFTESPRQVLNALTLYSVLQISSDFVHAVKQLAQHSLIEAVVVSFMAFSVIIWVFHIVQFLLALLCCVPIYIHIEKEASGLEEYCCIRVNKRISQIVEKQHRKGLTKLAEENRTKFRKPTMPDVNGIPDYDRSKSSSSLTLANSSQSNLLKTAEKEPPLPTNPFARYDTTLNPPSSFTGVHKQVPPGGQGRPQLRPYDSNTSLNSVTALEMSDLTLSQTKSQPGFDPATDNDRAPLISHNSGMHLNKAPRRPSAPRVPKTSPPLEGAAQRGPESKVLPYPVEDHFMKPKLPYPVGDQDLNNPGDFMRPNQSGEPRRDEPHVRQNRYQPEPEFQPRPIPRQRTLPETVAPVEDFTPKPLAWQQTAPVSMPERRPSDQHTSQSNQVRPEANGSVPAGQDFEPKPLPRQRMPPNSISQSGIPRPLIQRPSFPDQATTMQNGSNRNLELQFRPQRRAATDPRAGQTIERVPYNGGEFQVVAESYDPYGQSQARRPTDPRAPVNGRSVSESAFGMNGGPTGQTAAQNPTLPSTDILDEEPDSGSSSANSTNSMRGPLDNRVLPKKKPRVKPLMFIQTKPNPYQAQPNLPQLEVEARGPPSSRSTQSSDSQKSPRRPTLPRLSIDDDDETAGLSRDATTSNFSAPQTRKPTLPNIPVDRPARQPTLPNISVDEPVRKPTLPNIPVDDEPLRKPTIPSMSIDDVPERVPTRKPTIPNIAIDDNFF